MLVQKRCQMRHVAVAELPQCAGWLEWNAVVTARQSLPSTCRAGGSAAAKR
jgi:hypothetical protein